VYDPKERVILAAGLTDRVVHHALHDAIEPIIDRKFIAHAYACRRGKGQHRAIQAAQGMLRKNAYFMHLDVKKYFYSIDRQKLLSIVYQPDPLVRQACLLEASTGLEQLRLGLRMSVSLRVLNAAALYYATGCLVEEGKMLGGWIKKEYVKPNAPRYA
jgi:hypothetical protein